MYSNKTTKELFEVLEQYKMLTFESQLILKKELVSRDLATGNSELETAINTKLNQIKNLDYLTDLGFYAVINGEGIIVKRTTKAIVMDVLAVIVGLVVFFIGVYGVGSLVSMFVNGDDFNVFSLAINFAMASLVLNGFKFLNGIKRLFDFAGFQLSNSNGVITLKKRFDLRLEEIKEKASELLLDLEEDEMVLRLGEHVILNANAENVIQRLTIEELSKILKRA